MKQWLKVKNYNSDVLKGKEPFQERFQNLPVFESVRLIKRTLQHCSNLCVSFLFLKLYHRHHQPQLHSEVLVHSL